MSKILLKVKFYSFRIKFSLKKTFLNEYRNQFLNLLQSDVGRKTATVADTTRSGTFRTFFEQNSCDNTNLNEI